MCKPIYKYNLNFGHQFYYSEHEQQIEPENDEETFHPPIEIEFDIKNEADEDVEIKPEIDEENLEKY
jgi:hypothetical protein